MNQNNKIQELKRWLKANLKNKISISDKTVITFLMSGFMGLSSISYAAIEIKNNSVNTPSGEYVAIGNGTGKVYKGVLIGHGLTGADDKNNFVAVGHTITGNFINASTLIGTKITVRNTGSTAADNQATALGNSIIVADQSVAIGGDLEATGRSSIAIGGDDTNAYSGKKINYTTLEFDNNNSTQWSRTKAVGDSSVAIGVRAYANGTASTVLGTIARAKGNHSTAIGTNAFAISNDSIALGKESVANRDAGINGLYMGPNGAVASTSEEPAWKSSLAALSIGVEANAANDINGNKITVAKTRQIIGVAAGTEDTDAVNVAQLKGVAFKYYSINSTISGNNSNKTNDGATGQEAIAIGPKANAKSENTIALGHITKAEEVNSIAIGHKAEATKSNTIAIGHETKASATRSIAFGLGANATGDSSVVIGPKANSNRKSSIVIGTTDENGNNHSYSEEENTIVIGSNSSIRYKSNNNRAYNSVVIGQDSYIEKSYSSIVMGHGSKIEAARESVAIGKSISIANRNSTSLGSNNKLQGDYSIAVGTNIDLTKTSRVEHGNIAIGTDITAKEKSRNVVAIGRSIETLGYETIGIGNNSKVNGEYSVAIGKNSKTDKNNAVALGVNAVTLADSGVALGAGARVENDANASIALGNDALSNGLQATALGNRANAKGEAAIAIGRVAYAIDDSTVAIGKDARASHKGSTALGASAYAYGERNIAIGNNAMAGNKNGVQYNDNNRSLIVSKDINDAIAIGNEAEASVAEAIALGKGSVADTDVIADSGYDILTNDKSTDTTITWKANKAALSIGKASTNTRRIMNLAAGVLDTDAVNVAQLKQIKLRYRSEDDDAKTKTATIKEGLTFLSPDKSISISALDNGKINFEVKTTPIDDKTLTFSADNNTTTFARTNKQNKNVQITTADFTSNQVEFKGKNIATDLSVANDTGTIRIGIKDTPEFKTVTLTQDATQNNEAVRLGQLNNILTDRKITFKNGGAGTGKQVALGDTVIHKNVDDSKNLIVELDTIGSATYTYKIQDSPEFTGKVKASGGFDANNTKVVNVQNGEISSSSKDAVNGSQLFDIANKMGLVDNSGTAVAPNYTTLTNTDGSAGNAPTNLLDAVDKLATALNKGIKFAGNQQEANSNDKTQYLGSKLDIIAGNIGNSHLAKNLLTEYKYNGGNGTISIGLKDTPEFSAVDLKGKNGKDGSIGVDNDGNVVVTSGKDGTNGTGGTTSKVLTEASIGEMSLTYKANSNNAGKKTTTFEKGLDFLAEGSNLTVSIEADGKVKYTLAQADTITNDTNPANNTNKLVTENAVRNYIANQLNAEKTRYVSIKSSNGDENNATSNFDNKGAKGTSSIAIGRYTESKGDYAVALGTGANAKDLDTIALGSYAASEAKASISIGQSANSKANNSISLGNFSKTTTEGAVALGVGSLADRDRNVFGTRYDEIDNIDAYLTQIGKKADYDNLTNEINTKNTELISIQDEIKALENANQDATDKYNEADAKIEEIKGLVANQNKLISAWRSTQGAVSVGNDTTGDTRQITGVAAGTKDTDAVNVAQLNHLADREFIFTDGETGNEFVRKNSDNDKKITIKAGDSATGYKGDNLKVVLDKDAGTFTIGLKESPEFKTLALKDGDKVVNFAPSDENTLKLSGKNANDKIKLTNLADGEIAKDSTDAVSGSQLYKLKEELGLEKDPNAVVTPSTGPAGNDGLDGKSVIDKAEALRDGLAGNMIYTKDDGTRVVKEGDKYYEVDSQTGLKKDPPVEVPKESIVISTVNPDGTTTEPTTIANVKSALGLPKDTPNTVEKSVEAIAGTDGNSGLLKETKGLDKVVTLKDLQAVALAGMTFNGDINDKNNADNDRVHRSLGQELNIIGYHSTTYNLPTTFAKDNIFVKKTADDTLTIKLASKLNNIDSISGGDTKVKITLTEADKITIGAGANNTEVTLVGVANGEISETSKEAINGSQLKDLVKQLGIEVADNKEEFKPFAITTKLSPVNNTDQAENNPASLVGMIEKIMERMNKGYLVGGDQTSGTDDLVHTLGAKINVNAATNELTGKAGEKANKKFVGTNLLTEYNYNNGNADISIALSENPEFKTLTLKDGDKVVNFAPSAENTLKLSGKNANDKIKLTNLADGEIAKDSTDAVTGGQIFDLRKELGIEPKDKEVFDKDRTDSAGKDGLAGKTLVDKIEALRDGTAGNQVYTKPDGTRVIREVQADGTAKYFAVDPETGQKKDPAEEVKPEDLIISSVNPTGDAPIGMGNVKSGLGLDGKNADNTDGSTTDPKAISPEKAKTAIDGLLGKDGRELNNVATVGDLQAIAQAGLTFKANSGNDVHRPLSTTMSIVGNKTITKAEDVAKHVDKNVITVSDPTNNEISIRFAERPEFKGIAVEDKDTVTEVGKKTIINPAEIITYDESGVKIKETKTTSNGIAISTLTKDANGGEPTLDKSVVLESDNITLLNGTDETLKISGADGTKASSIVVKDKDGANGVNIDGSGKITGLEHRNPTDNGDYGVGDNKGRAATEGALRDITDKLGLTPDVSGNTPPEKSKGPGEKDKLDNKTFTEKINALRNGQAGPLVYTKEDGTRLVRDKDGNLYPEKADGTPDIDAGIVKPEAAVLSAVNSNGETTKPSKISNVSSGLGISKEESDKFHESWKNLTFEKPIAELIYADNPDKNNNVATVGDLRALGLLGFEFEGNTKIGDTVHRPVGGRVLIKGEGTDNVDKFTSASGNIQVSSDNKSGELTVKLADNIKELKSIETKDLDENEGITSKVKLDANGLSFTGTGGTITGLKDLDDNSPLDSAVNKNYVDYKINEVQKGVDKATSGVANAIAMATLTQVQHRGTYKNQITAGVGSYGGEYAIAAGLSGISKGGKVMYRITGSVNTRGNVGLGAAVGYQFNPDPNGEEALAKKVKELEEKIDQISTKESFKEKLYIIDNFTNDKFELTEIQMKKLTAIINEINEKYSDRIIDITGYTDMSAGEKYNLDLGLKRANMIEELMIANGLKNPQNIRKVSSFGYNNKVNEDNNRQISTNRRVEITVK